MLILSILSDKLDIAPTHVYMKWALVNEWFEAWAVLCQLYAV
jgi:hypothetical protein